MSDHQRHAKAAEYRALAKGASDRAAESTLDNVRDKHAQAAVRWEQLAVLAEPDLPAQPPGPRAPRARSRRRTPQMRPGDVTAAMAGGR